MRPKDKRGVKASVSMHASLAASAKFGSGATRQASSKQDCQRVDLLQRGTASQLFHPPDARRRVTSTTALRKQFTKRLIR